MHTSSNDTRPSIRGQLLVGRQSPELRETLWELIGEAKGGDPLAPVTVVGPSRYVNLSLRQNLGRCNFANVRFIVMPVLSELLGGAALARMGRKPLPAVLQSVLVREVLAEATGPLASVRDHPATHASVRASFRELRQVGEKVLNVLAARGHVRADVVRLYREFRRKNGREWYDSEDLAEAAASAVHRDDVPGLEDLGSIVFYLPRDVSPAETKLMDALAQRQRCSVLLGTTDDAEADRPVRALARALIPLLGQPETAGQNHDKLPLLPNEARLHVAPNAHQELRWVIRRIVREAGEAGIPFHRMAVLYRMDNPYASLILDELRMADIPVAGPDRSTLADSAVGRALTGLLAMSGSDFRRADVMSWLTGCPIRPAGGRATGLNPSRWDSLTRKAGIVRGMDQWRDRLNLYAERLSEDAARLAGAEEITEARAERMKSEAAAGASGFEDDREDEMNPGNFEVREIAGSPYQIGLRYGQSIKSGFSRIVAQYAENYLKNHDPARVEVIREGMEGYLRVQAPTLIEEMAGIAEGSGVSFDDVFKHNLCSCIGTTLSAKASVRDTAHCTSIGFPNSNRGPLLGRNTDCGDPESSLIRFVPMLCWRPSTGLASLGLTHMGTVWRHVGVNDKGLALGGSSVSGPVVDFEPGLTDGFLGRLILDRCATVEEAVNLAEAHPFVGAGVNFIVVDDAGDAAVIELSTEGRVTKRLNGHSHLSTTNFYASTKLRHGPDSQEWVLDNSRARHAFLTGIEPDGDGGLRFEQMEKVLRHRARQGAICQYWDVNGMSTTISTVTICRARGLLTVGYVILIPFPSLEKIPLRHKSNSSSTRS